MTPEAVFAIAACYDLEPLAARELDGGYSNESWLVECTQGRFIVRKYGRLHVTRRAIAFEHAVMEHAAFHLKQIRAPLRASDGRTLVDADGALAAVLPFIAGETGRRDPHARGAAAALIARFHLAMQDVHVSGGLRSTRTLGVLSWLRARFVRLAVDPAVARALDWSRLIAVTTGATARIAPLAAALPHLVVHGDVHPDNVVFDGDDAAGLIDFDFAHESERAYDVATAMDEFGRSGDDAGLDPAIAAAVLAAYEGELRLTAGERRALPELMIRRNVSLVWYICTRHGERVPGDVGNAARYLRRAIEIEALRGELRSAIA